MKKRIAVLLLVCLLPPGAVAEMDAAGDAVVTLEVQNFAYPTAEMDFNEMNFCGELKEEQRIPTNAVVDSLRIRTTE